MKWRRSWHERIVIGIETRQQEELTMTGMTNTMYASARAGRGGRRVLRRVALGLGVVLALIVAWR